FWVFQKSSIYSTLHVFNLFIRLLYVYSSFTHAFNAVLSSTQRIYMVFAPAFINRPAAAVHWWLFPLPGSPDINSHFLSLSFKNRITILFAVCCHSSDVS